MKLITFFTIVALSTAAQLPSRNYLPQNQGSQSPQGFQGVSSQGGFQQASHQQSSFQSQSYQSSQSSGFVGGSGSGDTGNRRPQQETEKRAEILKQDQDVTENGFHYSFETSNGIRAEEAGNSVQSQGGFSYKGDDGNTYSVTFTAGEGGFRPQGAHLPVAPPTPEDILQALAQNAKDEAAGIFDDGKYHPDAHGGQEGQSGSQGQGQSGFGSSNRQGSFNSNSGYSY